MTTAPPQTATAVRAVDVVKAYGKGETAVTALESRPIHHFLTSVCTSVAVAATPLLLPCTMA